MKLRCRVGWHRWTPWRNAQVRVTYLHLGHVGALVNGQKRLCLDCKIERLRW